MKIRYIFLCAVLVTTTSHQQLLSSISKPTDENKKAVDFKTIINDLSEKYVRACSTSDTKQITDTKKNLLQSLQKSADDKEFNVNKVNYLLMSAAHLGHTATISLLANTPLTAQLLLEDAISRAIFNGRNDQTVLELICTNQNILNILRNFDPVYYLTVAAQYALENGYINLRTTLLKMIEEEHKRIQNASDDDDDDFFVEE